MFIGVEDGLVSSVVSLGVPDLGSILVTSHKIPGSVASIPCAIFSLFPGDPSVFPVIFYIGYVISVIK